MRPPLYGLAATSSVWDTGRAYGIHYSYRPITVPTCVSSGRTYPLELAHFNERWGDADGLDGLEGDLDNLGNPGSGFEDGDGGVEECIIN